MSGARPSLLALVLDRPVEDVAEVVAAARAAGGIDRASAHRADGTLAQDVHWGGRMQRAVVRAIDEAGTPLLRTEVAIASDGLAEGLSRQVALLAALAQALPGRVRRVRDLSARVDRDEAWMTRVSAGVVEVGDAVVSIIGAQAPPAGWVLTHGAARFAGRPGVAFALFDVERDAEANGQPIGTIEISGKDGERFIAKTLPVPVSAVGSTMKLTFRGTEASPGVPALYEVRLVHAE